MKKKINRFKRLATLRKVDIYKEVNRSNLLENEILKNKELISQINTIIEGGKVYPSQNLVSTGFFKNNAQLISTLQSQKNIAINRNKYLLTEKNNSQKK